MEGLRSPRIGPSINTSAPAVNPGRAAAAVAAAAIIGTAGGGALGDAGRTFDNGYQSPSTPTRTAPVPVQPNLNPYLQGAQATRAPSLPSAMPSLPSGLNSASGGIPPRISGGSASALGALVPVAAGFGMGLLQGKDPLAAAKGLLTPSPFSQEAGQERERTNQEARENRQALGNFLNDLADKFQGKKKDQRKGDTFPNRTKPDGSKPNTGSVAGARYRVDITANYSAGGNANNSLVVIGPVSGVFAQGDFYVFTHAGGTTPAGSTAENLYSGKPSIQVTRLDGGSDPIIPSSPVEFAPDGSPLLGGLTPTPTNSNTPALPGANTNPSNPAQTSPLANTNPSNPAQTSPKPNTPSTPRPGQSAPSSPSPITPSLPNSGQPTLPTIPSAPTTGSASLTAPSFPSSFNSIPGQRNPEAYKPLQPATPEPQLKPGCADPCIATLQGQQASGLDALAGLAELLASLLSLQQQQQEEQQEQETLVTISVPVCSCNDDGTADIQMIDLQVLPKFEAVTIEQFTSLADIQSLQCRMQRHVERSHNILGGDIWFKTADSRTPEFKTKIERNVKEAGTLFGFPALAPEPVVLPPAGGTPAPEPVVEGQVKAKNMIDLLNAYTSNLYHRAGFQGLPTEVPKTLLGYTDDESPESIKDLSTYFVWFVKQVDALIGKFPINITVEDIDPLTAGNQTKEIELPNISEALAEMYGINLSASVNSDVSVNFLMRLASELIATKNASLITQDYAKANAAFLGYKGNPARREINYSFDPAKLDSLDEFLKESKGYLVGWEEDDKESVVGFLQRIVFSAGLIKSVFFKDKKRLAELQKELENMMKSGKTTSDAEWNALLALLNNPEEYFNKDSIPHPRVRDKPAPPPPEPTA